MEEKIRTLIPADEIRRKVKELALEIKKDFRRDVFCIVVLTGAMVFFIDLMRELRALGMRIGFASIKLSSYKDRESTGKINIDLDVKEDIKGKNILVVEDIADTGLTLNFLKRHLAEKGAKEVKICALLDKKQRRQLLVKLDYVGFNIPDKFVVGYGIDYNQKYRDLDFIGYIT
jgi:hypoxanthine phosphoribosyltransferase